MLWGLAKVNMLAKFPNLLHIARHALVENASALKSHNLATIMWTYASNNVYDAEVFRVLTRRASEVADAFTPQLLVTILWACATANYSTRRFV
ncbi:unnamed protein product, partial [Amoebophrya sp. A25]|eukprot:GSA25T00015656001.1